MWLLQSRIRLFQLLSLQDILCIALNLIACLRLPYASMHMPWSGTELALELSTYTCITVHPLPERKGELII
jgi:hypothetical protein